MSSIQKSPKNTVFADKGELVRTAAALLQAAPEARSLAERVQIDPLVLKNNVMTCIDAIQKKNASQMDESLKIIIDGLIFRELFSIIIKEQNEVGSLRSFRKGMERYHKSISKLSTLNSQERNEFLDSLKNELKILIDYSEILASQTISKSETQRLEREDINRYVSLNLQRLVLPLTRDIDSIYKKLLSGTITKDEAHRDITFKLDHIKGATIMISRKIDGSADILEPRLQQKFGVIQQCIFTLDFYCKCPSEFNRVLEHIEYYIRKLLTSLKPGSKINIKKDLEQKKSEIKYLASYLKHVGLNYTE